MQWSRLKRNVESLFAERVKGRVGLHSTRYRTMPDHDGRAWITLDGEEIINMVHIWKWLYEIDNRLAVNKDGQNLHNKVDAEKELANESFFAQHHLGEAMYEYQSMSINDIIVSENAIIRAIGMLDKRLGTRRLKQIDVSSEHPLVMATYHFRCKAEGLSSN